MFSSNMYYFWDLLAPGALCTTQVFFSDNESRKDVVVDIVFAFDLLLVGNIECLH